MAQYPATYTDAHGSEAATIVNDGETLRMTVRGVVFTGTDFDALEPPTDATPDALRLFSLCHLGDDHSALTACRLTFVMPIPMDDSGTPSAGTLHIDLPLGDPVDGGRSELSIVLHYKEEQFASSGKHGYFEDELLEIQRMLPAGVYMRACINCQFSDYSPYGHGLFGAMMCFRNIKDEYLKVSTKDDFFTVHDRFERQVQETDVCPEFERRTPSSGYRHRF